jgi:hypothetical protein
MCLAHNPSQQPAGNQQTWAGKNAGQVFGFQV